ncbi:hypothetical protein PIB30_117640 [Stylosanthes scabra]|uniref:THH1/TOM1/TOM3 domain-containing protein n=1 Tax=Stylosanthes scabra TaxID=79078 RepID=A0ABU6SFL4_9FABA|nr:hypothetical protein [Stylosanthes scabra]
MPFFAGSTAVPHRAVATPFISSSLLVSSMSLLLCSYNRAFVSVSLLLLPAPPRRAAVSVGAPFLCSCFAVQALLPASPFSVVPSLLSLIFPALMRLIILWLVLWWKPVSAIVILSKIFFAGVSLCAALGFLLFGGRLFLML